LGAPASLLLLLAPTTLPLALPLVLPPARQTELL